MQFGKWGGQSTIFGIPIAFALVIGSFIYIYGISQLASLLLISRQFMPFQSLGYIHASSFDFPRCLLLSKMFIGVFLGCFTLVNVALFRRVIWLARFCLVLVIIYNIHILIGVAYGLYLFFKDAYMDSIPYFNARLQNPIPWPARFWMSFALNVISLLVLGSVTLDMYWSYIKVLQAGGSGWEGKAFFEIHQSEGHTVATLQEEWDARLGIEQKEAPRSSSTKHGQHTDEKSHLLTNV